jgi:hypothetical protein
VLRRWSVLRGYRLERRNPDPPAVSAAAELDEIVFDEEGFRIRYPVATAAEGRVTIAVAVGALGVPDPKRRIIPVRDPARWSVGVGNGPLAPTVDEDREEEREGSPARDVEPVEPAETVEKESRLTAARHLDGNEFVGERDAALGRVEDFVIDDRAWEIPYLVLDTRPWWPLSKKVLVSRHWLEEVDDANRRIRVGLTREKVATAPGFDPGRPVTRDYEISLFKHYGRELAGSDESMDSDREERVP